MPKHKKTVRSVLGFLNSRNGIILLVLSLVMLSVVVVIGSKRASDNMINNSDSLILNYVIDGDFKKDDISVQAQHSNFLKIPLFYIQNKIGLNVNSFYLLNAAISLVTFVGWILLSGYVLGRRKIPLLASVTAAFLASSSVFNIDIGYSTVRNLEYLVAFGLVVLIAKYVYQSGSSNLFRTMLTLSALTYGLVVFSDKFFQYTFSVAMILGLLMVYLYAEAEQRRRAICGIGLVILSSLFSVAMGVIVGSSGLLILNTSDDLAQSVVPWALLLPSFWEALRQTIVLTGSDIFGRALKVFNLSSFINIALMSFSVAGVISQIKASLKLGRFSKKNFIVFTVFIAAVVTLGTYIIGNQVLLLSESDAIINRGQGRFLTLLGLTLPLGLVFFMTDIKDLHSNVFKRLIKKSLVTIAIVSVFVSLSYGHAANAVSFSKGNDLSRTSHQNVAKVLKDQDIEVALTGHWFGATTKFWMSQYGNSDFTFVPVKDCNRPINSWVRKSWFTQDSSLKRSAIVLDRTSLNQGDSLFWNVCSDEQIMQKFGQEEYSINTVGVLGEESIRILIYDYDVRTKLEPSNL